MFDCGRKLLMSCGEVLIDNICWRCVWDTTFRMNVLCSIADITHMWYTSHHSAWLSYTIVKQLHEPTSTIGGVLSPIMDQPSTKAVRTWITEVWMLGNNDVGKSGHPTSPSSTTRLLDEGQHIVWVVEVKYHAMSSMSRATPKTLKSP